MSPSRRFPRYWTCFTQSTIFRNESYVQRNRIIFCAYSIISQHLFYSMFPNKDACFWRAIVVNKRHLRNFRQICTCLRSTCTILHVSWASGWSLTMTNIQESVRADWLSSNNVLACQRLRSTCLCQHASQTPCHPPASSPAGWCHVFAVQEAMPHQQLQYGKWDWMKPIRHTTSMLQLMHSSALGMCGKPKFGSDSVSKNQTIQKFDICSDGFLIETACNQPFE